MGEAAAGDIYPDAVPRLEDIGGGAQLDAVLVDFVRSDQRGAAERAAVAGADDPLADVEGAAVRPDVAQLHGEVGVHRTAGGVERRDDRASDGEVTLERPARIDEHPVERLWQSLRLHPHRGNVRKA